METLGEQHALPGGTRSSGLPTETTHRRAAPSERRSDDLTVAIEAAQRAFATGVRTCQVMAFLIRDPLYPRACWITSERFDNCRDADGEDIKLCCRDTARRSESRPFGGTREFSGPLHCVLSDGRGTMPISRTASLPAGTDDDLLVVQMPSHLQKAWMTAAPPPCIR